MPVSGAVCLIVETFDLNVLSLCPKMQLVSSLCYTKLSQPRNMNASLAKTIVHYLRAANVIYDGYSKPDFVQQLSNIGNTGLYAGLSFTCLFTLAIWSSNFACSAGLEKTVLFFSYFQIMDCSIG